MKRRALLAHLRAHGCELRREGGEHSIWWNPANGRTSAVPRHTEIVDITASIGVLTTFSRVRQYPHRCWAWSLTRARTAFGILALLTPPAASC